MKVIIEGTDKQLNPIVLMLQGFGVSILDEDGNSLNKVKQAVSKPETFNSGSTIIDTVDLDSDADLDSKQSQDSDPVVDAAQSSPKEKKGLFGKRK